MPYIYKQYQSIIQPMGKKTTHQHYQNNNDPQLQKHRQLMARFDTLQVALAEAITQNQLRERVIELQALLVAVQMKQQAKQLKDKQQNEEVVKKDKKRKKMQKNRNYQ